MTSGLVRSFGLLEATALNMSNMIGVGPFITIPLVLSAMGGPQAMLGWLAGLCVALADGMIWSELGAALPGSGGSYGFLRRAFGAPMAFLFIWQFVLSGPLEIASGYIGFAQYAGYLWKLPPSGVKLLAAGVGAANLALLYRRTPSTGKLMVALWAGVLLTALAVVALGLPHFSAARAFDFPPKAFGFDRGFLFGLGSASMIALYDYLGYYDVCYVGDEVEDPGRVIPRSILLSLLVVAGLYVLIFASVIGALPWREAMRSQYVISDMMQSLYGTRVAAAFTLAILWTALASVYALLLGYSRVPYAAAKDGAFFSAFAALHPTESFPHVSLLVVGGLAILASFWSLDAVIGALMTTRILVQFLGQAAAVVALRRREPGLPRPYRMPFYPWPCVAAGAGWLFVFLTSGLWYALAGVGTALAGAVACLVWARGGRTS